MIHDEINPQEVPGLKELRQAIREEDARYEKAWDRAFDQGQGHYPKRDYERINALKVEYPEAAAIIEAEKRAAKSSDANTSTT